MTLKKPLKPFIVGNHVYGVRRISLGADASRPPVKSAVAFDVKTHVHQFQEYDKPVWEGSTCWICNEPLNGQRLK